MIAIPITARSIEQLFVDGEEMIEREKFYFVLYFLGCEGLLPRYGKERFIRERAFLDDLVGRKPQHKAFNRPLPPPYPAYSEESRGVIMQMVMKADDYFPLEDDQWEAYGAFS